MTGFSRSTRRYKFCCRNVAAAGLLFTLAGCSHIDAPAAVAPSSTVLRVAFGLASSNSQDSGLQQAVGNLTGESLIQFGKDGRPQARLAESWTPSPDGLSFHVLLRPGATFHDGTAVTADEVKDSVTTQLHDYLGPAFADIDSIRSTSKLDLDINLKARSNFVLEALDVGISSPETSARAGPFRPVRVSNTGAELVAFDNYYGGRPEISQIQIKPYASVRAAWADMLRGNVDMLYEAGVDAIDLLESSSAIRVLPHQRNYEYGALLNVQRPALRSAQFRQQLNKAIDRDSLISKILKGLGVPATGTVWPTHWANDAGAPAFRYDPQAVTSPHSFTCMVPDASLDRIGLFVQQQLHAVGVDMRLESVTAADALKRITAGDFDAILTDAQMGPTLVQPYRWWTLGNRRNWGKFDSPKVNEAFNRIQRAVDDESYRAGVSDLQRAIYDDPPAIFLAWSERARAVSTRFEVPVEPGRDILGTLRQWRPATAQLAAKQAER